VLEFSRLISSNCSSIHQDEHSRAQVAGVSSQSEQIRFLLLEKAMAPLRSNSAPCHMARDT
jgi:hypothetical protein